MRIFLTGGTGFIGRALCDELVRLGHQLTVLSRRPHVDTQAVRFVQNLTKFVDFDQFDAVINLAGEPIFDHRWSDEQKAKLRNSRVDLTRQLVVRMLAGQNPPRIFLSGSATGFYGSLPFANFYDEQTACSAQFSGQLCAEWEEAALGAISHSRVCLLRTGMVFERSGGALTRMLPLYRLGLGGKLGSGRQYWSWISLRDQLRAILFLFEHPTAQGAFNLVSPYPIPQAEFNLQLSTVLRRPAYWSAPAWVLAWLLGERSQLLLDNQPLVPARLLELGFEFLQPHLSDCLKDVV